MSFNIQGKLQDEAGNAIENAVVMVIDGPSSFSDMASVTDAGGGFSVANINTPGTYTLQIQHMKIR